MGVIPNRRMAMAFLLFVVVVLVASSPVELSAASPVNGTWSGTVGPGTGTVNTPLGTQKITTSSTVKGTFSGDTGSGSLAGTMTTSYSVPALFQSGTATGSLTGTYTMSIGPSGAVTGAGTIPLSGGFTGQFTLTLSGQESSTGQLTGTWTGTLTVTQVSGGGCSACAANITAPGSGQIAGTVQQSSSQTTSATTPEFPSNLPLLLAGLLMALGIIATRRRKKRAT